MKEYDSNYRNRKKKNKIRKFRDHYDEEYNEKDYLKSKKKLKKKRRNNNAKQEAWPFESNE